MHVVHDGFVVREWTAINDASTTRFPDRGCSRATRSVGRGSGCRTRFIDEVPIAAIEYPELPAQTSAAIRGYSDGELEAALARMPTATAALAEARARRSAAGRLRGCRPEELGSRWNR